MPDQFTTFFNFPARRHVFNVDAAAIRTCARQRPDAHLGKAVPLSASTLGGDQVPALSIGRFSEDEVRPLLETARDGTISAAVENLQRSMS
jgi:hypothetical protein